MAVDVDTNINSHAQEQQVDYDLAIKIFDAFEIEDFDRNNFRMKKTQQDIVGLLATLESRFSDSLTPEHEEDIDEIKTWNKVELSALVDDGDVRIFLSNLTKYFYQELSPATQSDMESEICGEKVDTDGLFWSAERFL